MPRATRPHARGRAQQRRGGARSRSPESRAVLLRGKLDLCAAHRKNAAAHRGFQRLNPRTSRRGKPLGLKLVIFMGLEIVRRKCVVAHGCAFGRGMPAPETM